MRDPKTKELATDLQGNPAEPYAYFNQHYKKLRDARAARKAQAVARRKNRK